MSAELRHIAIHVEEPHVGDFRWFLTERADGAGWDVLRQSPRPASTYQQAMADGLLALQHMVEDLDAGPRRNAQKAAAPKSRATTTKDPAAAREDAGAPSFFGFGPVR